MKTGDHNDIPFAIAWAHITRGKMLQKILSHFSSFQEAWLAHSNQLERTGLKRTTVEKIVAARQSIDPEAVAHTSERCGVKTLTLHDEHYPELLREISDPPVVLFYRGDAACLRRPTVAIIGSRRATAYGKNVTLSLTRQLACTECTIVSGLARGIDALAHEATVEQGGITAAVIGSGLDRDNLYPREHWRLMETIVAHGGAVLSEYPVGTKPAPHHFPERNRIVAGLSRGTVVIEASEKSGALITAFLALDYNRDVFAVPGNVFDKNSKGANKLLRLGARVVLEAADVANVLGLYLPDEQKSTIELSNDEQLIMKEIQKSPIQADDLCERMALPSSQVMALLSSLELKGAIKDLGAKTYVVG